jgi:hypothetical protein
MQLSAAAVSILVLTGCGPMNVSSYVERNTDFTQFHTYEWGPAGALSTGDPRLDNNPFFHDYFRRAVEERLGAKGLRQATSGNPDLLFHYHASMSQSFDVSRLDPHYGDCKGGENCEPSVSEFEAGTLVLDVMEASTRRVVWRASARQSVDGLIDNQEWMEEYITKSVARMMERFPSVAPQPELPRQ